MRSADIGRIKAIDMHTHYNHGSPGDSEENERYIAKLPFLYEKSLAANIEIMALSSFSGVLHTEYVEEENEHLFGLTQQYPWCYQWAIVDPRAPATYEQARKYLNSGKCLGLKIVPGYHGYHLSEFGDAIFSFAAEQGTTVLMHPDCLDVIVGFADKYKDVNIILAHVSGDAHIIPMEQAKYGNLLTDTSGSASINNNVIELAVSRIGSERILFGTDTYDAGFQRGRIEYAMISDKDKANILRENALRLFPALNK